MGVEERGGEIRSRLFVDSSHDGRDISETLEVISIVNLSILAADCTHR